jgi:hypothetical protein
LTNDGYDGLDYFKLLPAQGDRAPYSPIVQQSHQVPDSQFQKGYDYFLRRLRDPVNENDHIDPKQILKIIETRLMVVSINLSDTDDPYLIFESLNFSVRCRYTGRKLDDEPDGAIVHISP